jgi:GPH family glycoside/pentoside/hexuronide:cation symporter
MRAKARWIAYSVGTVSSPLLYHAISGYLIFFYTDVVRLEVGLISLAYGIAYGVWNAVNDPLVGQLSDRTRTRWGRRIPYILFGSPIVALLFFLVWSPPVGGRALEQPHNLGIFLYLFATIGVFDLFFSMVNTCYAALFPEMYSAQEERATVSIYRQVCAVVGLLLALGGMPLLVKALSGAHGVFTGWSLTGALIGVLAWAGFWISLLGSRERPEFKREASLGIAAAFRATLRHKAFLAIAPAILAINIIWGWLSTMAAFFNKYVLGSPESQTGTLFLAMFGASILCYPLWRRVMLRKGAKWSLVASVSMYAVLSLSSLVVGGFAQALAMFAALGAANAGVTLVREIVLSDVIDEDELITGLRREGMYFGVINFVERLSLVFVSGGTALVLKAGAFVPGAFPQSPRTIAALRLGIPALIMVALALFLAGMRWYPLDRKRVEEMAALLEDLHRGKRADEGARADKEAGGARP